MNILRYLFPILFFMIGGLSCSSTTSTILTESEEELFSVIEHALLHMSDQTGVPVEADTVPPGPHLGLDDFDHRRLDVALQPMVGGNGGYLHFGPDLTGDFLVMTNRELPLSVTNRHIEGDLAVDDTLELEETIGAAEIFDSTGSTLIKQAVLFEARTGGNILHFGPVDTDTLSVVIEEASHDHDD